MPFFFFLATAAKAPDDLSVAAFATISLVALVAAFLIAEFIVKGLASLAIRSNARQIQKRYGNTAARGKRRV